MEINNWVQNINMLEIQNEKIKNDIISFFKDFGHNNSFNFLKINNINVVNALNNINNYKPITICLDIEFQNAITNDDRFISYQNFFGDNSVRFIRELGILFFIRDIDNFWYYLGHIFVNFNSLKYYGFNDLDLKLIESHYSTVSEKTLYKMEINEKVFHLEYDLENLKANINDHKKVVKIIDKIVEKFKDNYIFTHFLKKDIQDNIINKLKNIKNLENDRDINYDLKYITKTLYRIQFEVYGKYLDKEIRKKFVKSASLYWNDKNVITRLLDKNDKNFLSQLNILSNSSLFLVKGMMDFTAIKNMYRLVFKINKEPIKLDHYYDIETFNGFSNLMFKSSQLEDTYKGLTKTKIYNDDIKLIFNDIKSTIGEKAHNPLADSLFTIIVAVIINYGLNDYFDEQLKSNQGGGIIYKNFIKYKNEYLRLKNRKHS